jgi:tyrosinase
MRLFLAIATALPLALRRVAASPSDKPTTPVIDIDPTTDPLEALTQLQQYAYATLEQGEGGSKRSSPKCSLATASFRRDW